jgi:hypothetical protein
MYRFSGGNGCSDSIESYTGRKGQIERADEEDVVFEETMIECKNGYDFIEYVLNK